MHHEVTEPFRALLDSVTELDPVSSGLQPQAAVVDLSSPSLRAPTERGLGDRTGRVATGRTQRPMRHNRVTRITPFDVEAPTDPRHGVSAPSGELSPSVKLRRLRREAVDTLVDAAAATSMSDRARAQNLLKAAAALGKGRPKTTARRALKLPRPRR